jgi:hypothetical protein
MKTNEHAEPFIFQSAYIQVIYSFLQKKSFGNIKNSRTFVPCDYPASRQNSALRVILLFLYYGKD